MTWQSHWNARVVPWGAALGLALFLILPGPRAEAHPADVDIQSQSILLKRAELDMDWKLIPGPLLVEAAWSAADVNNDGSISPIEALAWVKPQIAGWTIQLDGQSLGELQVTEAIWPATIDALQSGTEPIAVSLTVKWPGGLAGVHRLEVHNAYQESISLNWFTLKSQAGLSFDQPVQNNGLLQTNVYFPPADDEPALSASPRLTTWDSGSPSLPGLTDQWSNAVISLAGSSAASAPANRPANVAANALTGLVRTPGLDIWFLPGAMLLSLTLGALHALTPGHGKTLVAAYLVGSQGRTRDAVFLGSVVTVTHTGSVLLLGLITLALSRYILPTLFIPVLELVSGVCVVGFGAHLLINRGRALYAWYTHERAAGRAARRGQSARHTHPPAHLSNPTVVPPAYQHLHPHKHSHEHPPGHSHPGHDPDSDRHPRREAGLPELAGHDHAEAGHHHFRPANRITVKSLLALGVSGGLVPCPDAIAILLVAVAVNRIPLGMLLIVAFSLGLALVLIAIGVAMVNGAKFIQRRDFMNRFSVYTPVMSAAAVLVLGVGLTAAAVQSVLSSPTAAVAPDTPAAQSPTPQTSPAQAPTLGFDPATARILYLAPDQASHNQLFARAFSGPAVVQLTREPTGIFEFAIAPNGTTILYTPVTTAVGSAIWAIESDGTRKRLVLDCPESGCGGPQWSPDGRHLVYERVDYSTDSLLALSSIWWLDTLTGETRPVFQDKRLASYAPRFSPDGQWLSYISPSNNALQVYNLNDRRSLSIPYRSGTPEVWNPAGSSLLVWDPTDSGQLHLSVYDLPTNQKTDLSGAADESDYLAAWSPDGQWIAMSRATASADNSILQERLWLVRPDGSQAHILVDQAGSFFWNLDWSPDGRYLLYERDKNRGASEIWAIDVQTGQEQLVVSGGSRPVFLR